MSARGFSLIELLIALAISAVVAGIVAAVVPPSRAAFEQTPAALDAQQRLRTAVDVVAQAVRGAGTALVPGVTLIDPDPSGEGFLALQAIVPRPGGGQALLEQDHDGGAGDMVLDASGCPAVPGVCGFTPGATAAIADGAGRFELFTVTGVNAAARRVSASPPLAEPYMAGAILAEVEMYTFHLVTQPDGSATLSRVTFAGAVQPVVDHVSDLRFAWIGNTGDDTVREVEMAVTALPWPGEAVKPVPAASMRMTIRVRNAS